MDRPSSRAHPTDRTVFFAYHADGHDIPGGWEPLMEAVHDLMYSSESCDWWTLAVAYDTANEDLAENLRKYALDGLEDSGVSVTGSAGQMIVAINCRLDAGAVFGGFPEDRHGYEERDEDDKDENEAEISDARLALRTQDRSNLLRNSR